MVKGNMSLGNKAILAKIDRLRELNVGALIPLPQLVVVGDQSSGKSSVLESLTGFSFPRAAGLCTRYATQITCKREDERRVDISIIPRPDADDETKRRLLAFSKSVKKLNNKRLAEVFAEANEAMGIRTSTESKQQNKSAFSQDILKIEISGPEEDHLTVIDVPGIFRVATPGLTTESDIAMVENMVKSYMANSRTIILAVVPCNVDIATQGILKMAEAADPTGIRTMGVLTKPDLANERATQTSVVELIEGKRNVLNLGYYVVKNRSADDESSTLDDRAAAEEAYFTAPPWNSVAQRCGTLALKTKLSSLLIQISKKELPHVRSDIEKRLLASQKSLNSMGMSRADPSSQRLYLGKMAGRFQSITQLALTAQYAGDAIFTEHPNLKLITRIVQLNKTFSTEFTTKGHKYMFPNDAGASSESVVRQQTTLIKPTEKEYPKLCSILRFHDPSIPKPSEYPIIQRIKTIYETSCGPELGTFSGSILSAIFQEQSSFWNPIILTHTSHAICIVHSYIMELLEILCPEDQVRELLWNTVLLRALCAAYKRAMQHAEFLLQIERSSRPITYNHYFNDNLQKRRADRFTDSLKEAAKLADRNLHPTMVSLSQVAAHAVNRSNDEQICEDILDTLFSYYKVARKRIVDVVCQQVVSHFLLDGPSSPLLIFGPDLIMGLEETTLETIAGEDALADYADKS